MNYEKQLQEQIVAANADRTPLAIQGGGTKSFYGREITGTVLDTTSHKGVVNYDPTELVLTVKAGTPLREIEALLDESGQMLGFEPPHFGDEATIGGAIATGLSGPARPFVGSVRDFVLGVKILSGQGEIMHFGGQVMKNVAGFDVSRVMVGAMGTLGVLLEVSMKVLPKPALQLTKAIDEPSPQEALHYVAQLRRQPLPLSAAAWIEGKLFVRLSGAVAGVKQAAENIRGDVVEAEGLWTDIKEHKHPFFDIDQVLFRLSVKPTAPPVKTTGVWPLIEWGGAVQWIVGTQDELTALTDFAEQHGGHVSCFRNGARGGDVFQRLSPWLMQVQQNIKTAFDPNGILNPGRLYKDW